MLVQVDWYTKTGKWKYGGRVEINANAWDSADDIIKSLIKNQKIIVRGWEMHNEYYVVLNDIPESQNDPNYRTTYARLYTPDQIEKYLNQTT